MKNIISDLYSSKYCGLKLFIKTRFNDFFHCICWNFYFPSVSCIMEMKDGFFCPSKVRAYILNLVYENDVIVSSSGVNFVEAN